MRNPVALVIEDDDKLAAIFLKALETAEYDARIASDGKQAQTHLANTAPDLVVLDLHLPYVSGMEILHQIRSEPRLAHTCVIVVTADLFRAEPLREEVESVLIKPISFKRFLKLVTRLRSGGEGRHPTTE